METTVICKGMFLGKEIMSSFIREFMDLCNPMEILARRNQFHRSEPDFARAKLILHVPGKF